jgi:hypothetical protein
MSETRADEPEKYPGNGGGGYVRPTKKGEKRGGRPRGVPNKTTRLLKEAILLAAEAHGEDGKGKDALVGYLKMAARKYPKSFLSLLGRVIPLQVIAQLAPENRVYRTAEEIREELRRRGIPIQAIYQDGDDARPVDAEEVK